MSEEDAHATFLDEAIRQSRASMEMGGGPFGAIIVRDGEIVGRGTNRVTLDDDPTAHAEIAAIREACAALGTFDLSGCTLYASCEPCPMCLGAIHWARLDSVVHAATRDDAAEAGFADRDLHEAVRGGGSDLPMNGPLCRADAVAVLTAWHANPDRKTY